MLEQRQHGEGPEKDPEAEDASGAETGGHAKLRLGRDGGGCGSKIETLPSTNMAPDGGSIEEENHFPGTLPQVLC